MSLDCQPSSYSTHRVSTGACLSGNFNVREGMAKAGQTRVFNGPFQIRSPSVYGGAGGCGTRISRTSVFSWGSGNQCYDTAMISNEKWTMQILNERLASYLEKVRSLEAAKSKLELQITEFYASKTTFCRDFTGYFATIADLRYQITKRYSEKQHILLQIENAQLAAEDFKMKYGMELHMRETVEADVFRQRCTRDNLTLSSTDLEVQIEYLTKELIYMKSSHEEEKRLLRVQEIGAINVDVELAVSVNLTAVLEEMREQYEALILKNKLEIEKWFKAKVDSLWKEGSVCTIDVQTFYIQLSELKRTYQSLEINSQGIFTEIQCLWQCREDVKTRCSLQLSQLQVIVNTLETDMQQLRVSIERQQVDHSLLLDVKMRLELEIAEYRRLLGGDWHEKRPVVIVQQEEKHEPHIEVRVTTTTEKIIDGDVVSSSVDIQTQDLP